MYKRLLTLLLSLAMIISLLPDVTIGVSAEGSQKAPGASQLCDHTSHEGWTAWGDEEAEKKTLPTAEGKYYLTADVDMTYAAVISADIHLCLNDHTVTQKTAGARHIYLKEGKGITLSIYDCGTKGTITGGSSEFGTVINVTRTNTFSLYGGKITGNNSNSDAVIYVQAAKESLPTGGVFNMYGGEISGNAVKNGVIYSAGGADGLANSQVNIYGGTIKDNQAAENGGAIYAKTYGTVNISNAEISGNEARLGGAIYTQNDVVLTLKNTTITGNTAVKASAIYAQNKVQITIEDTTITGNETSSTTEEGHGAAAYLTGSATKVVLAGKTYIHDNTIANEKIADLYINSASGADIEKVYVKDLNGYVKFGIHDKAASITEASQVVAFEGAASTYTGASVSYMAGTEEKHVTLVDGAFKFVTGHFHKGLEYTAWTDGTKVPASGTYYLDTDIIVGTRGAVRNDATLKLCMNGHTIKGNGKTTDAMLRVENGSAYISDCTTKYDENGYFVSGGKFENGLRKGNGAAVYVNKATSVLMVEGIAFVGNNSTETSESYGGGAVQVRETTNPAKFIGCLFENNTSSGGAGALSLRDGGDVVLEKCVFTKNTAKHGGAIYITGTDAKPSSLVVDGCKIMENTADNVGGISNLGVCSVIIKDTRIAGNSSTGTDGCGAVNLANGDAVVKLQGKVVIDGNTDKDGAAQNLHLQAGETINIDVSALGAGSKVGVCLSEDRIEAGHLFFSTVGMTAVPDGVTSDNADYQVVVDDQGRLALKGKGAAEEGHAHKLCNDASCTSHGDAVAFRPWEETDSLPTSGNYYLTDNVNVSAATTLTGDLNLCLNGKTIKQTGTRCIYYTKAGADLTITDCAEAYNGDTYTGGLITGGKQNTASAVYVISGTTFNLFGGRIADCHPSTQTSAQSAAAVFLHSADAAGATFNMYGGEITNCGGDMSWGGAVTNGGGHTGKTVYVNIYGGKIFGNRAMDGGAIRLQTDAVATIYGGEITGNHANAGGGAVYLHKGAQLILKGGKITGNEAALGGGIYVTDTGLITVSDAPVVKNNLSAGKKSNLHLAGQAKIQLGQIAQECFLGVTVDALGRAISTETTVDLTANFVGDSIYKPVIYKDKTLYVELNTDHQHCLCLSNSEGCDHTKLVWNAWESETALPTSGTYYLTCDVQLSASYYNDYSVKGTLDLCLNGHTVTAAAENKRVLMSGKGGTINLTDCNDKPGMLTGGTQENGAAVYISAGATFNMYGGKISGNKCLAASSGGSAVFLQGAGAAFNMYGGEISGNESSCGTIYSSANVEAPMYVNIYGGIIRNNAAVKVNDSTGATVSTSGFGGAMYLNANTQVTIYGGAIENNTAQASGGGILIVGKNAVLTINGGSVTGNTAKNSGGGMYISTRAELVMNGGSITGNIAKSGGGAYFLRSTVTLAGGTIDGNYAKQEVKAVNGEETRSGGTAGGFYGSGAKITLKGTAINGNKADSYGGGIVLGHASYKSGGVTMYEKVKLDIYSGSISNNISNASAGGLLIQSKETVVNISGGNITGNKAKSNGGGIYVSANTTLNVTGGTFADNTAKSGGAVYMIDNTQMTVSGGAIKNNAVEANGGGIMITGKNAVMTMKGGTITGNTAKSGAGIIIQSNAKLVLEGGTITGNTAKTNGGGVYISTKSELVMNGGTITGNTAKSGGGAYFLRSTVTLAGGTIGSNRAKQEVKWANGTQTKSGGTAGGFYGNGAKITLKGTAISGNKADSNGGGIVLGRASYTSGGVTMYENVKLNMYGGSISNNTTEASAGGMLIQSKETVVNISGGIVSGNKAKSNGGGIYVSTNTTLNVSGGTFTGNMAKNGGAFNCLKSTTNITGGSFYGNTASYSAGMLNATTEPCVVTIKNVKIYGHQANKGGALASSGKAAMYVENCEFYDNQATSGQGGAVSVGSNFSSGQFNNCKFFDNSAATWGGAVYCSSFSNSSFKNCQFYGNHVVEQGGALMFYPASTGVVEDCTFTENTSDNRGGGVAARGNVVMKNCLVKNNTAKTDGGGVYTDVNTTVGSGIMKGLEMYGCQIKNNTAGGQGGGFFVFKGCRVELYDTEITGNKSAAEGGAMWVYEDLVLHNTTITGNTSGNEGYAVYMNDADYDGHSYFTSRNKLSGDVVIKDNEGGDLWMGPDVVFVITADGLGVKTHIELAMDSGVVTNRIFGAYHYEGGNQVYTITYGDRSIIEPEYDASLAYKGADTQTGTDPAKKTASTDIWLYAGIGLFAVLIIAVGVILVVRKKKAGNPARKASK